MLLKVSTATHRHTSQVNAMLHTEIAQRSAICSIIRFKLLPHNLKPANLTEEKIQVLKFKTLLWHLQNFKPLADLLDLLLTLRARILTVDDPRLDAVITVDVAA